MSVCLAVSAIGFFGFKLVEAVNGSRGGGGVFVSLKAGITDPRNSPPDVAHNELPLGIPAEMSAVGNFFGTAKVDDRVAKLIVDKANGRGRTDSKVSAHSSGRSKNFAGMRTLFNMKLGKMGQTEFHVKKIISLLTFLTFFSPPSPRWSLFMPPKGNPKKRNARDTCDH